MLRQQEKDANYLYQLYTIALAQFDNEKALKYIETRAALDTTNYKWQNEAGLFVSDYIADYDKALRYYQTALRNALAQYGDTDSYVAASYNNIGFVYYNQGKYEDALDYYKRALEILTLIFGEKHRSVAMSYNNIALIYSKQSKYDEALEYNQKAMEIQLAILENSLDSLQEESTKAIESLQNGLEFMKHL